MLDTLPSQHEARETSDAYIRVITIFGRYRVVVGTCNHQWIVQTRRGTEWRAVGYFRTRSGLLGLWHRLNKACECESWPELERLPEFFAMEAKG